MDVMNKVLRCVVVKLVKVQLSNHSIQEATWELEEEMREKHPQLFQDSGEFRGLNFYKEEKMYHPGICTGISYGK